MCHQITAVNSKPKNQLGQNGSVNHVRRPRSSKLKELLYELLIEGDDGYRVYVNGEKVIDYWGEHASAKREYTLKAIAGTDYKIRIEYMQA